MSKTQSHQKISGWRVEVSPRQLAFDNHARDIKKALDDLGLSNVKTVTSYQVYNIWGDVSIDQINVIAQELLSDPVTEKVSVKGIRKKKPTKPTQNKHTIEVAFNPGVMDPVAHSTIKGICDLGIEGVVAVHRAQVYTFKGMMTTKQLHWITEKVLLNKLIQHVVMPESDITLRRAADRDFELLAVPLAGKSASALKTISHEGQLSLSLSEMKTIQDYFARQDRDPTDCELETFAQTWSEHCYHKTFRGRIEFTKKDGKKTQTTVIDNLLKSTIMKATLDLKKSWCVSVFHDNAGVIKFDQNHHVCFKVETHNHPSALEPYGGASTGIGGVLRDIMGTGLGAKPIANTDVFCFARPDHQYDEIPAGTLHPKRVLKGVVSGVRDYGNKMGIPTVNGAVLFDDRYIGNPLVYCGSVGIMPKNAVHKKVSKGDLIVVAGGKTGRDGIHGATFSSIELSHESEIVSSGAVQIGDPIQEKKVLDVQLKARDAGLYSAVTDCGAGGLSSAIGEMGEHVGARVDLQLVPLKYDGLTYTEIWISESQERMVFAVPKKNVEAFLDIFQKENVEATVIGVFSGSKRLELFYDDVQVCDLEMDFLHNGIPQIAKKARWQQPKIRELRIRAKKDYTDDLKNILADLNIASKEWIIRQYDHEVQGASVVKPLSGVAYDGPSDAAVIQPLWDSRKGLAISNGINPRFTEYDPYWMAISVMDEAIRQIVAVGGSLDRIAVLDNFCWGNPDKPDRLGSLVLAAQGCQRASMEYQIPFISGKDSLYNEFTVGKKTIAIPGTLLISALGVLNNVKKTVTMDFKQPGHLIYVLGKTYDEMGGSVYLKILNKSAGESPKVRFKTAIKLYRAIEQAHRKSLIRAAHDCSEGGLAVALSEMAFSAGLGARLDLKKTPSESTPLQTDRMLFSESNSRFVMEVSPRHKQAFEALMKGLPVRCVGEVTADPMVEILDHVGQTCVRAESSLLKETWQKPLMNL